MGPSSGLAMVPSRPWQGSRCSSVTVQPPEGKVSLKCPRDGSGITPSLFLLFTDIRKSVNGSLLRVTYLCDVGPLFSFFNNDLSLLALCYWRQRR